jgi:uncharacterized protein with FMN-binding domain
MTLLDETQTVPPTAEEATTSPRVRLPQPRRKHPSHGARVIALVSSVSATVGVGAALAHADAAAASQATGASTATATVASSASSVSAGASPSTVAAASATASTTSAASTSVSAASAYADGTYTGASEWTKWGNYQVQVTIQNGKIVSITETETPSDNKSVSINGRAAPVLESEAIAAQSANINAVSGATYTSTTYKASLQSALDLAAQTAAAQTASA